MRAGPRIYPGWLLLERFEQENAKLHRRASGVRCSAMKWAYGRGAFGNARVVQPMRGSIIR